LSKSNFWKRVEYLPPHDWSLQQHKWVYLDELRVGGFGMEMREEFSQRFERLKRDISAAVQEELESRGQLIRLI